MTSSLADSLVGRVIDRRYRILSHLADGGMASVYVAMDARLDREVAVKIMRPGLAADHVFVERFRSEARAAARLSHPNVVAVFDQGEDGGDVFLAMELVHGKTLREVIHEEAPLTPREALAILEPILEALRAAHTAGLIHRDVKPENVIVRHDGEVKVADFGLARAISNQTATTQTGVLLGTVSYLAPEQVERGAADPRSDVYAAGLLLFEMLTGRKAVTGDTPIQIAYKHVHGRVAAPSSVVAAVPGDLDDLVARATANDPADRFGSATEFLTDLRATRRRMAPGQLDHRGVVTAPDDDPAPWASPAAPAPTSPAPAVDPAATQALPVEARRGSGHDTGHDGAHDPGHDATRPEGVRRPDAADLMRAASAGTAATAGRRTNRSTLSAGPVHEDDGPEVEHTTALPLHEQRPRRRRRPGWLAAVVALVLLGGTTTWWFTAGPGGTTVVPRVTGQPVAAATVAFDRASLEPERVDAFSETVPKGVVVTTEPAPGTEVSKSETVRLVVSKGPERYAVPQLVGARSDAVADTLAALNLRPGAVTQDWSETVPAGVVVAQTPAAGTSVKRDTAVAVVVSKGRQPITVPDVRGAAFDAANAKLTQAGLTVKRGPDVNSDTVPAGHVVSQSPAKGTLFRGDAVTLVVSKGPVMVGVPNVVGRPVGEAEKILGDLGFKVQKEYPFGRLFDLVRVQSVEGGQQAPKGSTIVLTIV